MNNYYVDITDLDSVAIQNLIGYSDSNLKVLTELYNTDLVLRDNKIIFLNDDFNLFNKFKSHIDRLLAFDEIDEILIRQTFNNDSLTKKIIGYTASGKPIKTKTINQSLFIESINNNDLVFALGPAGTGKTYLAVFLAVKAYKEGLVKKIILTRPAVEAGESLGFLPGDLKEKIDPYLMPLYDSLYDIIGQETCEKLIEKNVIEILPLAYMRGRTLNDAFIILDEAQNTTASQMLMALTRLGFHSKMIVNGDITQIDLKISKEKSGLVEAVKRLKDIKNIGIIEFNINDIVRNPLVSKIIERFK